MLKLRTILLYNYLYYILLLLILLLSIIRINIPQESNYTSSSTKVTGIITTYTLDGNKLKLTLKAKEKLIVTYYFKTEKEKNDFTKKYQYGDKIEVIGEFKEAPSATSPYLFNYKKYLYNKHIFYLIEASSITKKESNKNIYYYLKYKITLHLNNDPYLNTFILGNKSYLTTEAISSYQENGISHLFAISGMHISLLSGIILKLLTKLKLSENKKYLLTTITLIFYASITELTPSIIRGVLFFILFSINKIYYFYIKPVNLFIISLVICLLLDSYYLYDIGFWYSYSISFVLIVTGSYINKTNNYLLRLLKTSIISFIASIPISLYSFYQLNFLSILYNLIYVPFVSIIIFPLSLLTVLIPILLPIYHIFIIILEKTSIFLAQINILEFTFPRLNIIFYIIYYLTIILIIKSISSNNITYQKILPLIILSLIHYLYPYLRNETYIKMIDVGQGDSILLHSNSKNILIDTGGTISYQTSSWAKSSKKYSIVKNTTIPILKSLGIRKIDYLILTHGDADHMGEANYLVDNFKVENIIINSGEINYLEEELIKKRKDVMKGYEGLQISCGKFELIQLNEEYQDENTGSQIYYVTDGTINILLTGDASIESELNLLDEYALPEMDILKVGHHGSKTSSSKKFINTINPKYSLISCGKDNKFGHPNSSVLDTLKDSKIYRTDKNGSVTFKIKNKRLEIETCEP